MIIKSLSIAKRMMAAEGKSLRTEHVMIFDLAKDTQDIITIEDRSSSTDILKSWSLPIMEITLYTRMGGS